MIIDRLLLSFAAVFALITVMIMLSKDSSEPIAVAMAVLSFGCLLVWTLCGAEDDP